MSTRWFLKTPVFRYTPPFCPTSRFELLIKKRERKKGQWGILIQSLDRCYKPCENWSFALKENPSFHLIRYLTFALRYDDIYLTFITSESKQSVRAISTGNAGKSLKYSFRTGRKLRKRNFLKSSVMAINNNETIMRALKLSKSQFLGRGASVFSTILTN